MVGAEAIHAPGHLEFVIGGQVPRFPSLFATGYQDAFKIRWLRLKMLAQLSSGLWVGGETKDFLWARGESFVKKQGIFQRGLLRPYIRGVRGLGAVGSRQGWS